MTQSIVSVTTDKIAGGIANSLIIYSKALLISNVRHLIIIPDISPSIVELEKMKNVDLIVLPPRVLKWHLVTHFVFSPTLKKVISGASTLLLHNARLIRKFYAYRHKTYIINHSGKLRYLSETANIIFLTTRTQKRFLASASYHDQHTLVIPHAFDVPEKLKTSKASSKEPIKIMAAGRMVAKKGFVDLLAAAEILQRHGLNCHINFFGDGPEYPSLCKMADTLNLKNVNFCGWVNNLEEKFQTHDIFCLTSYTEAFGLVIGEAMRVGLPVVTSDADGPVEILGTDNPEDNGGKIYPTGNVEALASALGELIQNAPLRSQMGVKGQQTISRRFSFDILAQNLQTLYQ